MLRETGTPGAFSLLGGPTHRIGLRLGLIRAPSNTLAFGVVLGLVCWSVLLVLDAIEHGEGPLFSMAATGVHVRLLVAIPLFFACESLVDPRIGVFLQTLVRSRIVTPADQGALDATLVHVGSWKNSTSAEVALFLAACAMTLAAPSMPLVGASTSHAASGFEGPISLAGWWYFAVCLTLFRFLMLRWIWRIGLWVYLLWRLSRLRLDLVATHPDRVAGLGYLEVVQGHFTPLILAISALQSASIAEEVGSGRMSLDAILPAVWPILFVDVALFVAPLLLFAATLWRCRVDALSDYMELASRYVGRFRDKWLGSDSPPQEPLLGTPDLQSLADLGNSLQTVRDMRWLPVSRRLLLDFAVCAVLPLLPLLLFRFPAAELGRKFVERLTGL